MTIGRTLDSDPIEEARRQWVAHGWAEAADGMAAVTSIVRAQQIVLVAAPTPPPVDTVVDAGRPGKKKKGTKALSVDEKNPYQ